MSTSSNAPLYFSLDASGVILGIAPTGTHSLGALDNALGRSLLDFVHSDDRHTLHQLLQTSPEAIAPDTITVRWQTDSPSAPQVQLTGHRLQTRAGANQWMVIAQPLSEMAWGDRPMPLNEPAICETLVNEFPNGSILIFDQDLRYVRVGGKGLQEVGYHPTDLIGKTLQECTTPTLYDQLEPVYRAALAGEEAVIEVSDRSHQYQVFGLPLHPSRDRQPVQYGMVLTQDISPLRRAESILQEQARSERQRRLVAQTSAVFSRHIRRSLNLSEILQTAVDQIAHLLDVDRVFIYRVHSQSRGEVLKEQVSSPELSVLHHQPDLNRFSPECYEYYKMSQVRVVNDTTALDLDCPTCMMNLGARAKLVTPILRQDQLWGILVAQQCQSPRQWQDWEVELMRQLASQLEIAVYQSELYCQVQRLNKDLENQIYTIQKLNTDLEEQIQLRTQQLQQAYDFEATLKRITDKVRDSLNEDQILQAAVREVALVLQVSGCNAAIYDLDEGTSTVRYEYTTTALPYHGRVVNLQAFPEAYSVLLQGQPIQFCSLIPNPIRGTVATLAVPILDENGVLGDLWLIHHSDYAFTEPDIRLVQQVANQCAIAIRQARLYQASMAQVKELEKLNQLKDDFLSTVSHELRTPMSNVKMAIQMLGILLRDDDPTESRTTRVERYLQILHEESQREINLINDLLDLSRLDSGADELQFSAIALPQWIPSIMRVFEEQAKNHQQYFEWVCPDHLPLLTTDAANLERILTELLGNAFKYTPAQESITVLVREVTDAASIQISVTNTGVEIPEAEQERIFEKFYRVPNNDPWQHGGTGLGLALVKQMVQRMYGSISVHSVHGQTRFTIQLPIVPPVPVPDTSPVIDTVSEVSFPS